MKRDLISVEDLSLDDLRHYLDLAEKMEALPVAERVSLLVGRLMMTLFYEPSTRTKISFAAAMAKLGGTAAHFDNLKMTSVAKGESFTDTIKTVEQYADVIVIRHPHEGASRLAAEVSKRPVVNAGDGANQHPTQTLLDLYTIAKLKGRLNGLTVAVVGDLKYSRTVHSLLQGLSKFRQNRFLLVSPPALRLRDYERGCLQRNGSSHVELEDLRPALAECDILYMTRIQKERFPDPLEYERVKDSYCLDKALLQDAHPEMRVLHPLPRVNEIAPEVDETPFAGYFGQVRNGLVMRQAILLDVMGGSL